MRNSNPDAEADLSTCLLGFGQMTLRADVPPLLLMVEEQTGYLLGYPLSPNSTPDDDQVLPRL